MDLKEYTHHPDEGVFEQVRRKVALRRGLRIGAVAAVAVVAVTVATLGLSHRVSADDAPTPQVQLHEPVVSPVQTEAPAAEPPIVHQPEAEPKAQPEARHTEEPADGQPQQVALPAEVRLAEASKSLVEPVAAAIEPVAKLEPAAQAEPEAWVEASEEGREEDAPVDIPVASANPSVRQEVLWMPNVIIPSAEDEENRYFRVVNPDNLSEFSIRIFNRRGHQVFASNDPLFRWDGTTQGAQVAQGAYVWVAQFRDSDGRLRQEKGTVTVIR